MARRHQTLLLAAAAAALVGCAAAGPYVWVEELRRAPSRPEGEYVIGPGDLLAVRVFGQEAMSATVRVRADGRITLPLVAEREAAGLTPATLAELLEAQYRTFVNKPVVTVSLEERRPGQVSVLGAVTTPGVYPLRTGAGLLDALAQAGGLTPRAAQDRLFVVRTIGDGARPLRVRFRYRSLLAAEPASAGFTLLDGDVVYVE